MYAPNSGYIPENNFNLLFFSAPEDARTDGSAPWNAGGL
jgi:hypothetical protein